MLFLLLPDLLQSADIMGPQPFLDNHGLRATLPSHQLPTIIFLCPIPHRDMDLATKPPALIRFIPIPATHLLFGSAVVDLHYYLLTRDLPNGFPFLRFPGFSGVTI